MPSGTIIKSRRVLEPEERIAEVLFGLIMVLTFTSSLSIAEAGRETIRVMLIGALGCNVSWGIIDGVLYLMSCLAEKNRNLRALQRVRKATDPQKAQQLVIKGLPAAFGSVLEPAELESMWGRLKALPEPPRRAGWDKHDWLGALGVFLWVFATTFPVAVPFIFMHNVSGAMRVSNGVAIGMLFLTGFAYGRCVGWPPWLVGLSMVVLGSILVALTIALGG
ncbi:MAG TPA: VIT1/CCC1 transporter family protein [Candidatus Dormibacteraeota bacterium]|nr:VIT1/CCC1 transporter family protein [Candidatus Dormibacteraeota bacterium]